MIYAAEYIGWVSSVRKGMAAITAGVPFGGSALVDRVVDDLHQRYVVLLRAGYKLPRFSGSAMDDAARTIMLRLASESGYSTALVRAFLVTLHDLAKSGKIPAVRYDPIGTAARQQTRATVDPGTRTVAQRVTATAKTAGKIAAGGLTGILMLAAVAAGGYYLMKRGGK